MKFHVTGTFLETLLTNNFTRTRVPTYISIMAIVVYSVLNISEAPSTL